MSREQSLELGSRGRQGRETWLTYVKGGSKLGEGRTVVGSLVESRRKKLKYRTIGEDWGVVQVVAPKASPSPLAGSDILPALAIDEDPSPSPAGGNKTTPTANQKLEPSDNPPKGGGLWNM